MKKRYFRLGYSEYPFGVLPMLEELVLLDSGWEWVEVKLESEDFVDAFYEIKSFLSEIPSELRCLDLV